MEFPFSTAPKSSSEGRAARSGASAGAEAATSGAGSATSMSTVSAADTAVPGACAAKVNASWPGPSAARCTYVTDTELRLIRCGTPSNPPCAGGVRRRKRIVLPMAPFAWRMISMLPPGWRRTFVATGVGGSVSSRRSSRSPRELDFGGSWMSARTAGKKNAKSKMQNAKCRSVRRDRCVKTAFIEPRQTGVFSVSRRGLWTFAFCILPSAFCFLPPR